MSIEISSALSSNLKHWLVIAMFLLGSAYCMLVGIELFSDNNIPSKITGCAAMAVGLLVIVMTVGVELNLVVFV